MIPSPLPPPSFDWASAYPVNFGGLVIDLDRKTVTLRGRDYAARDCSDSLNFCLDSKPISLVLPKLCSGQLSRSWKLGPISTRLLKNDTSDATNRAFGMKEPPWPDGEVAIVSLLSNPAKPGVVFVLDGPAGLRRIYISKHAGERLDKIALSQGVPGLDASGADKFDIRGATPTSSFSPMGRCWGKVPGRVPGSGPDPPSSVVPNGS